MQQIMRSIRGHSRKYFFHSIILCFTEIFNYFAIFEKFATEFSNVNKSINFISIFENLATKISNVNESFNFLSIFKKLSNRIFEREQMANKFPAVLIKKYLARRAKINYVQQATSGGQLIAAAYVRHFSVPIS